MKASKKEIELFEQEKKLFIENGKENELVEVKEPFSFHLLIRVKGLEKANTKLQQENKKLSYYHRRCNLIVRAIHREELIDCDDEFGMKYAKYVNNLQRSCDELIHKLVRLESECYPKIGKLEKKVESLKVDRAFFICLSCLSILAIVLLLIIR